MLSTEGPFLYNYGAESLIAGDAMTSLPLLERASLFYSSSNLYLYLGDNYKLLKRYKEAEASYTVAQNIQPSRFLPNFHLLRLYQETGSTDKAIEAAETIETFPVKILSREVQEYRSYAHSFLAGCAH